MCSSLIGTGSEVIIHARNLSSSYMCSQFVALLFYALLGSVMVSLILYGDLF